MRTVAALYIDPRGPYPGLGVETWDERRDAKLYQGPHAVVAHPPCGPWGKLRKMHLESRHSDASAMEPAVRSVQRFGGVLEQPAGSKAFEQHGLPLPGEPADEHGGRTIAVVQVEWGHVARKPTWLYLVGVPDSAIEAPPYPGREPSHWCSGFREHSRRGQTGAAIPPGIKVCSAQQRRRTPPLFVEYLVRLARASQK